MPQKKPHCIWRNVSDRNLVDLFVCLLGHKRKQETKRIPVTALSVSRQIAFGYQVFKQKAPDSWSNEARLIHCRPPVSRNVRIAGLPDAGD
jgi:hypothetical protein